MQRIKNNFLSRLKGFELFDATGMSKELRQSLYWVIWGVTAGMLCFNVTGGAAWTGFQREVLKANDFQLGLIAAIPVAANVLQIFFSFWMERKRNRRFAFLFFGVIGRSLWAVIGVIPFFIPVSMHMLRIITTIVFVVLISAGNSFVNLGFSSLMGDLVPMRIRGQYFSSRQRVSLVAGILAGLVVSFIIDKMGTVGYSVVLILAGIFGVLDIVSFLAIKWPPMAAADDNSVQDSPLAMIKDVFKNKQFMMLCIFFTCWHFSVSLASPFNNVYLLEVMKMSFVEITLFTQIVSNLTTVLSVSIWGRLIDRYGNKPVMQSVGFVCMLVSLLWVFMKPGSIILVILFHFLTGMFWISIDMGQQNLYLGMSPTKNRTVYVAVFFAMINLLGIALGNALGGLLVQGVFSGLGQMQLQFLGFTLNKYHYIFILSTILRVIVMLLIFPRVNEEGSTPMRDMLAQQKKEYALKMRLFKRGFDRKRIMRKAAKHLPK